MPISLHWSVLARANFGRGALAAGHSRVRPSLRRPGQTIELAEDTVAVAGGEVPFPLSEEPAPVG